MVSVCYDLASSLGDSFPLPPGFATTTGDFFYMGGDTIIPRVSLFVDGFNLYHSVKFNPRYKWLDIRALFAATFPHLSTNLTVYYFTALAHWLPKSMSRHNVFIRALRTTGVKCIYGNFKPKDRYCPLCGRYYEAHEEKESDVNLAVQLVSLAYRDEYDIGIILSGDNDLSPAIQEVKAYFPSKRIGVLLPINRRAQKLKSVADFNAKITVGLVEASLFPDVIITPTGQLIHCPAEWT